MGRARRLLAHAVALLRAPRAADLEAACLAHDLEALHVILAHAPELALRPVGMTEFGPLVFAAVADDLALVQRCLLAGDDRSRAGTPDALARLGLLEDHPLQQHPQRIAVPVGYLGAARLAGARRVFDRLWSDASADELEMAMPLAVAIRDEAWLEDLVARGVRADAVEYPGYHLEMLDPSPAQSRRIADTGGAADPEVSTSPPGFEEGDWPVMRLSEVRRSTRSYWMSAYVPRRRR